MPLERAFRYEHAILAKAGVRCRKPTSQQEAALSIEEQLAQCSRSLSTPAN